MKKILSILVVLCLLLSVFAGCGSGGNGGSSEPKWLKMAVSFMYPSLDVHKDYNGWYTSIYGISETLFRVDDDMSIKPLLATENYIVSDDGLTWTFELADAKFSNGNPVTAEMVVRNLQRLAEVNERFAYLKEFTLIAADDKYFSITTKDIYPTLLTDLTSPEMGIMDLDATEDFDNAPVCTGPFVVKSMVPEETVEVERNTAYWNGDVKLEGATFIYLADDEAKLNAMQAGDVYAYNSVTAAAKAIYEADPKTYNLTVIPATRLQFYVLNKNNLSDNVRAAINLTVDNDKIAEYLGGTVSAAVGPFNPAAPYGQVTKPAVDTVKAKELIEADGYTMGDDGFYQKDGKTLEVRIHYYKARSLDSIAVLMQEQLQDIGIKATPIAVEDADSTYAATGDYDIALYCMIADKAGDPYFAINSLFREASRWAKAGFANDECEALINELEFETDVAKRAELANRIVQMVIDDNAFGFVGLFNKTTVTSHGVTGVAESCPFDFYGIDADTDMN